MRKTMIRTISSAALIAGIAACTGVATEESGTQVVPTETAQQASVSDRRIEDEIIYFVLPDRFENGDPSNDRGGIEGGRLKDGFDPTDYGFYHGGDLKGLTDRLDYIQGLGMTAIWLTPMNASKASASPT